MTDVQSSSEKDLRAEKKAAQAAADRAQARKAKLARVMKYVGMFGIFAAIVGGLIWLSQSGAPITPPSEITADDWKKGNPEASVVLLEYSDLQCPACAYYNNSVMNQLMSEYGDRVLFVYRHFPLRTIHPNADEGAWAAEAAGKQGKFFEMVNVLFANQQAWQGLSNPYDTFEGYAKSLSLDIAQFATDYNANDARDSVNGDYKSAIAAGLSSTPSFFINGQYIQDAGGYDGLKAVIEAALAANSQAPTETSDTPAE